MIRKNDDRHFGFCGIIKSMLFLVVKRRKRAAGV